MSRIDSLPLRNIIPLPLDYITVWHNKIGSTNDVQYKMTWEHVESLLTAMGTDDQTAAEVPISPILGIVATDTQAALAELKSEIDNAIVGAMNFIGPYDAAANSPDLDVAPSGVSKGDVYVASTAGTFFTKTLEVGDTIYAKVDGASLEADWAIVNKNLNFGTTAGTVAEGNHTHDAIDLNYNNAFSGLTAGDIQSAIDELDQQLDNITDQNGLISGSILWSGVGLTFNYTNLVYRINGVTYTTPAGTIDLSAADPSLDRIDSIYVDITGVVNTEDGTPSASPAKPSLNPSTQLELTFALVASGATVPAIVLEGIYLENSEWAGTALPFNPGLNFGATSDPYTGTTHIDVVGGMNNDDVILLSKGSTYTITSDSVLELNVKLTAALASKSGFSVGFKFGGLYVGSTVFVSSSSSVYGFDHTLTGIYQTVGIPVSDLYIGNVDEIEIRYSSATTPNSSQVLFDQIRVIDGATFRHGASVSADRVSFDPTNTPLTSDNLRDALIELSQAPALDKVLSSGNVTGGFDISVDPGDKIKTSSATGANIELDQSGVFHIGNNAVAGNGEGIWIEPDYTAVYTAGFNQKIELDDVSEIVSVCSTREVKLVAQGATGVTVLRSSHPDGEVRVQSDNFVLQPISGFSFTHQFTGVPTADRVVTFQDKDCTVACLTDIPTAAEEFYLERVETINESSTTPKEYFTHVQSATQISNVVSAIGGTYLMRISFVCRNTSSAGMVTVEPKIGATPVFAEPFKVEPDDGQNIYYVNIEKRVTLTAGNNTINLELSNQDDGTARIYEANVTLTQII